MLQYKLKGCKARDINDLVSKKINNRTIDVKTDISIYIAEIISKYTIKDCVRVIMDRGDFHHAYLEYSNRTHGIIDTSDKENFHRELAFYYVDEIVNMKFDERYSECCSGHKTSVECSICLENIDLYDDDSSTLTKCNHLFHKSCLNEWKTRSAYCPLCRNANI
jgi:hypothetical protein